MLQTIGAMLALWAVSIIILLIYIRKARQQLKKEKLNRKKLEDKITTLIREQEQIEKISKIVSKHKEDIEKIQTHAKKTMKRITTSKELEDLIKIYEERKNGKNEK